MKVSELIHWLQGVPGELEVYVSSRVGELPGRLD